MENPETKEGVESKPKESSASAKPSQAPSSVKASVAEAPEKKPSFRCNPCCGDLRTCGTVMAMIYIFHGLIVIAGVSVYTTLKTNDRGKDLCSDIDRNCSRLEPNSSDITEKEKKKICDDLKECRTREQSGMTMASAAGSLTLTGGVMLIICTLTRRLAFLCLASAAFGLISTALLIWGTYTINDAALLFTDDYKESQKDHEQVQKAGFIGGPILHSVIAIYMAVSCVALFIHLGDLNAVAKAEMKLEPGSVDEQPVMLPSGHLDPVSPTTKDAALDPEKQNTTSEAKNRSSEGGARMEVRKKSSGRKLSGRSTDRKSRKRSYRKKSSSSRKRHS